MLSFYNTSLILIVNLLWEGESVCSDLSLSLTNLNRSAKVRIHCGGNLRLAQEWWGCGACLVRGRGWCMAPLMYQLSLRAETGKLGGRIRFVTALCTHTHTHIETRDHCNDCLTGSGHLPLYSLVVWFFRPIKIHHFMLRKWLLMSDQWGQLTRSKAGNSFSFAKRKLMLVCFLAFCQLSPY